MWLSSNYFGLLLYSWADFSRCRLTAILTWWHTRCHRKLSVSASGFPRWRRERWRPSRCAETCPGSRWCPSSCLQVGLEPTYCAVRWMPTEDRARPVSGTCSPGSPGPNTPVGATFAQVTYDSGVVTSLCLTTSVCLCPVNSVRCCMVCLWLKTLFVFSTFWYECFLYSFNFLRFLFQCLCIVLHLIYNIAFLAIVQ